MLIGLSYGQRSEKKDETQGSRNGGVPREETRATVDPIQHFLSACWLSSEVLFNALVHLALIRNVD